MLDSVGQSPGRSRAGYFLSRLKVNTTSAGVSGVPSENLTPWRMVNVSDLLPAPHDQAVASIGVVFPFCSGLTKTSGSLTNPSGRRGSDPVYGVKPHGPRAPVPFGVLPVPLVAAQPP